MTDKIPLSKPFFDETELNEVRKVLSSGWVAGQGPKNKELESEFSKYAKTKHAVCVGNCTAGLHLALAALGVGKGDEVIVPDFTFPATAHAVLYLGAKPVFVDVDRKTYNIDPKQIEAKITSKTKVIMPVHTFGQCADMDEINRIAKKHNLKVVEDAACAVGSTYKGKMAGSMSDIACFSFHGRKNITCGEGGIITTDNEEYANHIRKLAFFGITSAHAREKKFQIPQFTEIGYNYKLSDIAASIVLVQLKKCEKFIEKKNKLAEYYAKKLKDVQGVSVPFVEKSNRHAYQSYVILLDKGINRDEVILGLGEKGVQANIGTYALHVQPIYQKITDCNEKNFPNAKFIYEQSLALPMFYEMEFKDIDKIASALKEVLGK